MSTAPHDNVRGRWLSGSRQLVPRRDTARGVAAVELAIALAVTLLIAGIAVAAYRTYAVREEVRAGVAAVQHLRVLVADSFARTGILPASALDLPGADVVTPRHRYVERVAIDHGRIEIRFGNDADESLRGQSLYVAPFETMDGEVHWLCGNRQPGVGLYPLGLFGGTVSTPELKTTVEPRYLPSECR